MDRKTRAPVRVLLAVCALALAPAARAQTADSIFSKHVKEADNATGQDTNNGYGIKTGHLADSAVTAPKLANGAVTSTKLGAAAVGTAAIADGAVTSAKIAGAIPASKIDRTGLDADALDGYHASAFQQRSPRVLVVDADAPAGPGVFNDPVAALASIPGVATPTDRWLVKIMPGIYTLRAPLRTRPYVDIEGSGELVTKLVVCPESDTTCSTSPKITSFYFNNDSEVRGLTYEGIAVVQSTDYPWQQAHGAARLRNVTINNSVLGWGTFNVQGPVILDHVTIDVVGGTQDGAALNLPYGLPGSIVMRNSVVVQRDGQYGAAVAVAGPLEMYDSRIEAHSVKDGGFAAALQVTGTATVRNSVVTAQAHGAYPAWSAALWTLGDGALKVDQSEAIALAPGSALAVRSSASAPTPAVVGGAFLGSTKVTGQVFTEVDAGTNRMGTVRCVGLYDASYAPFTCP